MDDQTHGEKMKALILTCGIKLWRLHGEQCVTARKVGAMIDRTHSAVLYHFDTADKMKAAIASEAVRLGDDVIVPQLIASRHPAAASLSADDRRRYLAGC